MTGWVKVDRKITEWEWYKDINTRLVFEHLLYTVNHAPARWRGIEIAPGQIITSIKKLADENGITEQNVRTALKHLQSTGEITKKSTREITNEVTSNATLITVNNWASHQFVKSEVTSGLTSDLTSDQHLTNIRLTTNNNNKNNNNKNIIKRDIREISAFNKDHNAYKAIKEKLKGGNI